MWAVAARLLVVVTLVTAGSPQDARRIDRDWFSRALAEETARWRTVALRPNGFFAVALDRQWIPAPVQYGTLVSQARQIFVMVAGYEHTGDPAYLDAVRLGTDFLLRHFRDPEHGLLFYSVDPAGQVLDDSKNSYGLAFAIFALSHAARVNADERYRAAALETWAGMQRHLRDETGFFRPGTDRAYARTLGRYSQNPMMHLFEALLALHDATASDEVLRDAGQLADAVFTRLFDPDRGRLPELFDADWRPVPPDRPGSVELGHQFEWAFLLSHAVEKGLPETYLAIGERLLDYGMTMGYDQEAGGVFSRLDADGAVIRGRKGWWEQCEALRALLHYAVVRERGDLWPPFDRSLAFAQRHFIDADHGGWFAAFDPARPAQGTGKGSIWQAGYHVSSLYREALRLAR